jgi:dienelactone hydrolase
MLKNTFKYFLLILLLACSLTGAFSQDLKERLNLFYKTLYKPMASKPEIVDSLGFNISNKVVKPAGDGPFPAVVLIHTAGGLANGHIKKHAQNLLAKGYVVYVMDSMGPRGYSVINESTRSMFFPTGVKDAYDALDFLTQQTFVDKNRIYEAGMSWGGFVATLLGSKTYAIANGAKQRFRATVSFYSSCSYGPYKMIYEDTDMPVLMLLAGADRELKHGTCFKELEEYKKNGMPVDFHIYEGIGHGWDKMGENQYGYIYNEEITKDSFNRMVEFFEKNK